MTGARHAPLFLFMARDWTEKVIGKTRTGANRIRTGAT